MKPTLREEKKLWRQGYKRVVGLDEAGMGPLAGPVVAAAVVVTPAAAKFKSQNSRPTSPASKLAGGRAKIKITSQNLKVLKGIRDSKKLTAKKREEFYKILTMHPDIHWGVGRVSEGGIDKINILNASRLAMQRALARLEKSIIKSRFKSRLKSRFSWNRKANFIILDGTGLLDVPIPQKAIVKADEKVFSCAAASIIAKVTRDRIMMRLHKKYPQYGFDKHKGYPTRAHIARLKRYGISEVHRTSFAPVRKIQNSKVKSQNYRVRQRPWRSQRRVGSSKFKI